ncbi:hypothetical protein SERLA73DRAFT_149075 [Serpula lacrymans var. lacrymans S7.3]|uniref:Uncharacterized protein n=1 Tax=Serpula lacrymans var. lacrymans (strain S7.3) TaxID=936435 RepID=F8PEY5_SERL3|nr:hypothetical protein SERLA73DRAFT_149075 [Serpula lacrymans var. lacrymans S7.3]
MIYLHRIRCYVPLLLLLLLPLGLFHSIPQQSQLASEVLTGKKGTVYTMKFDGLSGFLALGIGEKVQIAKKLAGLVCGSSIRTLNIWETFSGEHVQALDYNGNVNIFFWFAKQLTSIQIILCRLSV